MACLDDSVKELLAAEHPTLDVKQLHEGENVLKESGDVKYIAVVKGGKISRLKAVGSSGEVGTTITITPPVGPNPAHTKVCICKAHTINQVGGDGCECWWIPDPGEKGDPHRA
jgi:hypothetical protein